MHLIVNAKIADLDKSVQSVNGLFISSAYLQGWIFFTHNVSSFIILNSLHSQSGHE